MIQFNLLPDVKLEYIRAQRLKQTIVSVSVIAAGGALTILVILFLVVNVFQKEHLKAVNNDIKASTAKLQSIENLNKILTVQNQLNSLPELHAKKPVSSRLFDYLQQIVPAKISISSLNIDFAASTIQMTGSAENLATVNQFVDTLKFTTFNNGSGDVNAFTDVVLSSFSRTDKGATYSISAKFNPAIFDSAQSVKLTVPKKITTRSEVDSPSGLFSNSTKQQGTQ